MSFDAFLARYARPVPRYTSYPTAPHFAPLQEGSAYAGWLEALAPEAELSLYLHVPFCGALCYFCGCHTTIVNRPQPVAAYAETLREEIALVAAALGKRLCVRHLHWGGGTPTILGAEDLAKTMRALARYFEFTDDAEIAFEIDPRTLSLAMVDTLKEIGATRASLGVQDFDPAVMESVHRRQTFEEVQKAVLSLRGAGIAGINFDLMYGLPHQSEKSVTQTARRTLELAPDRIALFGYAHVPWVKRHQELLPEDALPDLEARFRQREAAARVLSEAGYVPVGFDHFAHPGDALAEAAASGRLHRNFQGYTTDLAPALIGFGASAISALPHAYVQNAPRIPEWSAAVRAGRLPVARGIVLSTEDRMRREVIETILCRLEVDLAEIAQRYGASYEGLLSPALAEFADDGLIAWDGRRLRVAEGGRPFLRAVAAAFDEYYRPEAGLARYSQGI